MQFTLTEDMNFLRLVESSNIELEQLQLSLKKRIKKWQFHPLCKSGKWDGYVSFIDKNNRIPIGLWYDVYSLCKDYGYEFNFSEINTIINSDIDKQDFIDTVNDFFKTNEKIKPHEYQLNAALKILKWQRCIAELATSAGKTLIIFLLFMYLLKKKKLKKMLIIVPKSGLVIQTVEGFEEYSMDKKLLKFRSQMIGGGRAKAKADVQLVVGTYQTLCKLNDSFYEDFDVVCVDECHHTDTKSIKSILAKCKNVKIKFGLSGTTKTNTDTADRMTMISLLGPVVAKVSGKYLTDNGYATPLKIKMIYLDYLDKESKEQLLMLRNKLRISEKIDDKNAQIGAKMLNIEQKLIIENKKRNSFICDFVYKLPKNSLLLYRDIKNEYGKKIYNRLKRMLDENCEIFYVDGSTPEKNREIYKKRMDRNDGKKRILVASFGTFSTGISINAINNIVFLESYKSDVIIKQSIGRGMRKNADKHIVNIIDIVDDFSINGWENYTIRHADERENIYKSEKYVYKKIRLKL